MKELEQRVRFDFLETNKKVKPVPLWDNHIINRVWNRVFPQRMAKRGTGIQEKHPQEGGDFAV